MLLLTFRSAGIVFHNYLELHSTISKKKNFHHKFSFLNGYTQTPHPLNGQNQLSVTNVFCRSSLSHLFLYGVNKIYTLELPDSSTYMHTLPQKLLTFLLLLGCFKSILLLCRCKPSFEFVLSQNIQESILLQNWKLKSCTQLATCTERKSFNRSYHQQSYPVDQSNPISLYFFTLFLEFLGILRFTMTYLVKALDSESRGHVIKTTGWLQGWLTLT